MANHSEPSSSISFTSPSHISNGSNGHNISSSLISEPRSNLEIISLNKLSAHLSKLLIDSDSNSSSESNLDSSYSDAVVVVEGIFVSVHRCILAARSKFFNDLFKERKDCVEENGKFRCKMSEILPFGNVGFDAFVVFLSYLYTGKMKAMPPEVSTCVHNECPHDACRPAIEFAVELMYASVIFKVPELVSLFQRRLLNFVEKALIEDVVPILLASFHCELTHVLTHCIHRVARSDLDNISLDKELPFEPARDIKLLRKKSRIEKFSDLDPVKPDEETLREKRIKRIHKALDSDDVELVKLLLTESNVTLDEAEALHYAAAYCDPKVVSEVLGLDRADVNCRSGRGYTVLHVAAMRKEPSIIVSLLDKKASVLDMTWDGQSPVGICKRRTRPKDYNAKTEQGQEAKRDRLCIDLLEREIMRNPMGGDVRMASSAVAEDLHMKLLHLENRVAFARLLFPAEAKLAMEIANAQTTLAYPGLLAAKGSNGNLREMDLNETPLVQNKRLMSRMEALSKTVEMGRRYFPHCSEVIDKFMLDDLPDLFFLEKGTQEEQEIKRTRFVELKEDVQKAFTKDKAGLSVTMQAQKVAPPDMISRDKFLVQGTVVPEGTQEEEVTSNTFAKEDGKIVDERRLKVILIPSSDSPELSPVNGTSKLVQNNETRELKDDIVQKNNSHAKVDEGMEAFKGDSGSVEATRKEESIKRKEEPVKRKEEPVKTKEEPVKRKEESIKSNDMEEMRLAKDVEETKLKVKELESKLSEAKATILHLTEEKRSVTQEKHFLQGELDLLKSKRHRAQVGFPLLFVVMVALVSLYLGYLLHR